MFLKVFPGNGHGAVVAFYQSILTISLMSFGHPQLPLPLTPVILLWAEDLQFLHLSSRLLVQDVEEVLVAAVGAGPPSRLVLPLLETVLAELVATAGREMRILHQLGADAADEFLRRFLEEFAGYAIVGELVGVGRGGGSRW